MPKKEFNSAYSQLNKAQQEAVDLIDGPVLVIAGPGTGKTQLLSLRVANILARTDTDPSSVLCLTFTNMAANNMRRRLNDLIGGDTAHNINVRTFHSFAAEIMQSYPDYFWNGAKLTIVPDALQLEIIQSILSELPLSSPLALKFADNFTATYDIQAALQLVKEAGLTPDKLASMTSYNLAYIDLIEPKLAEIMPFRLSFKKLPELLDATLSLPDARTEDLTAPIMSLGSLIKSTLSEAIQNDLAAQKTSFTSAWKRKWLQSINGQLVMANEQRRNNWWLELSKVYSLYRDRLHNNGHYDYSDMLIEVISALENNPELLAAVAEKYLYVLIDEFQDSNAAQLRLVHLISGLNDNPNIMAVGDDDQSIYAFNGAELSNMLSFERLYSKTKIIVLSDSYRSNQNILDASESIISQSSDRLVNRLDHVSKELKAVTSREEGEISHLSYPTREHQLDAIAEKIKQTIKANPDSSIAVLARSHKSLVAICPYLIEANIPISYERQNNVLELELIKQITYLSEIVSSISSGDEMTVNYYLSRLLAHPAWKVKPLTLWQLAKENYGSKSHWLEALASSKDKSLVDLASWLMWLSKEALDEPLPVIIEYLVGLRAGSFLTSPLRDYYMRPEMLDSNYLKSLSGFVIMQNLISDFANLNSQPPKLDDFVRFMRVNRELGRSVVDTSWFVKEDKTIELLTIHKAKGLEFDNVFLIDAVENEWQPKRIGRTPPANLPLTIYGEHFDDYARLAYVAASRSRRSLIVSSYRFDANGQSTFVSPLFSNLPTKTIDVDFEAKTNITVLESALSWPDLNSADAKALLKPRLNDYSLSPTALLQFLDVNSGGPQRFYERYLLRIPELTSASMAYGTAMHAAMQRAQSLINTKHFSLQKVIKAYEDSLDNQVMTLESQQRYKVHGNSVLTKLFNDFGLKLPVGALPETVFSDVQLNQVRLSGTIDHIYDDSNNLIITDYKTGTPLTSFKTRSSLKAIKAWRHRTQLLFYCLMLRSSGRYKNMASLSAQITYLEAESLKDLSLSLSPSQEELDRLSKLIEAVWDHIMRLDFIDTSSYPKGLAGIEELEKYLLKN